MSSDAFPDPLVLLVEDEPPMRRVLRAALGSHGYRVIEAVDGAAALSEAATRSPDIILLDLGLPDLDGVEAKPFSVPELLARMRVAQRHRQAAAPEPSEEPAFVVGDLRVDMGARQVFAAGEEKRLTPTEYRLLLTLVRYAGRVVTHRQLLAEAWGEAYVTQTHYLRVYMGQLRHKLEPEPARPRYLVTEPGVGYRLRVE